jgi:hypothetical protein
MSDLSKKGIRALGIAESFRIGKEKSILAGVVQRGDLQIDGVGIASVTVGGMDATDAVIRLFEGMKREDINVIILSGCIISLFNIIDMDRVFEEISIPIICVTYKESDGLEGHIMRFDDRENRMRVYKKLGQRVPIKLHTGHEVFVRFNGMSERDATNLLNRFTTHGKLPEPIRISKIIASTVLSFEVLKI